MHWCLFPWLKIVSMFLSCLFANRQQTFASSRVECVHEIARMPSKVILLLEAGVEVSYINNIHTICSIPYTHFLFDIICSVRYQLTGTWCQGTQVQYICKFYGAVYIWLHSQYIYVLYFYELLIGTYAHSNNFITWLSIRLRA